MFDPTPDTGSESPFNSNEPSEWGEGEDVAPIPVGVLRGHVTEYKKLKDGRIVINVKCDDPSYAQCEDVGMFPDQMERVGLATSLGIMVRQESGQIFYRDSDGKSGGAAFVGKSGLFIFAPYVKDGIETPSIKRFGNNLPKPGNSQLWDAYIEQSNFSAQQLDVIKKAKGGAIPVDKMHLFTE
jgi:hypothetical protein